MAEPERTCGTCATCRWWDRANTLGDHLPHAPTAWHACHRTAMEDNTRVDPTSLAVAWDHEEYAAELYTAPEFGCVQWAAQGAADG